MRPPSSPPLSRRHRRVSTNPAFYLHSDIDSLCTLLAPCLPLRVEDNVGAQQEALQELGNVSASDDKPAHNLCSETHVMMLGGVLDRIAELLDAAPH